jgi:putative ATP-dependent endonuclease of OLD family
MYDPYVAEFFFGGRTVIVEGDTEYAAFREVIAGDPAKFHDVHLVRALAKYTIVALCKILNQFKCSYSVLHDADLQRAKNGKGQLVANSPWVANGKILEAVKNSPSDVRLIASLHTFEVAMFGELVSGEKPYASWLRVREDAMARKRVLDLLEFLVRSSDDCPAGVLEWDDEAALSAAVAEFEPVADAVVEG